eukprot:CAMPEP_0172573740 /NCGR_PEP_ID=MMETSP1067-20121228/136343_1 /TAXON_ID=265564 ORGANISM="Thalassiosira punctigera, Strain Tpunct2005C2" /NCGR_SAMPLE_ID=MMETSP1067 /ASSEMBLY_ACC=CAM_ASM_000444 /LENGTH=367 /DNA_ID=CAMNT_0013366349 /DNA_START=163 /DNA_END=1268 /DNA_ORIENTATION=+
MPPAASGARHRDDLAVASSLSSSASSSASHPPPSCPRSDRAPAVDATRGGGGDAAVLDGGDVVVDAGNAILRFLDSSSFEPPGGVDDRHPFHVQGLRWHLMSLVRDAGRLERLAERLMAAETTSAEGGGGGGGDGDLDGGGLAGLEAAANYVINFNMAGFFRVQADLFDPFLRQHLCEPDSVGRFVDGGGGAAEADAFEKVVGRVEEYRVQSESIGRELYERAKAAASNPSDSSRHAQRRRTLLADVTRSSRRLVAQLAPMRHLTETLVVPAIARVVPPKVQKSFNSRVLRNLGLLESRVHLVGMRDAVWESGIVYEMEKFEEEIPYVARIMIERWRKSLYLPKAEALDLVIIKIALDAHIHRGWLR